MAHLSTRCHNILKINSGDESTCAGVWRHRPNFQASHRLCSTPQLSLTNLILVHRKRVWANCQSCYRASYTQCDFFFFCKIAWVLYVFEGGGKLFMIGLHHPSLGTVPPVSIPSVYQPSCTQQTLPGLPPLYLHTASHQVVNKATRGMSLNLNVFVRGAYCCITTLITWLEDLIEYKTTDSCCQQNCQWSSQGVSFTEAV